MSDESGRFELYVRAYPGPGKWAISTGGGGEPKWSADGRTLYYQRPGQNSVSEIVAVMVETEKEFHAGSTRVLFEGDFNMSADGHPHFDVSPEEEQFAMIDLGQTSTGSTIHLVLNWSDELERLVLSNA